MQWSLVALVTAGLMACTGCSKETPFDEVMRRTENAAYQVAANPNTGHLMDAEADVAAARVLCLQVQDKTQQGTCNAAVEQLVNTISKYYGGAK